MKIIPVFELHRYYISLDSFMCWHIILFLILIAFFRKPLSQIRMQDELTFRFNPMEEFEISGEDTMGYAISA